MHWKPGPLVVAAEFHRVETTYGEATISLPSRQAGSALLPPVPAELQRRTEEMYARHRELEAARRGDVRA